jgi:hypothetical protein
MITPEGVFFEQLEEGPARWRLDHTLRTVAWPSGRTSATPGERRDRDRAGIVEVVLVHIVGGQQPDPRAQLGLDVQDPFPGRDQLLGEQVPMPWAPSTAQGRCGQATAGPAAAPPCGCHYRHPHGAAGQP